MRPTVVAPLALAAALVAAAGLHCDGTTGDHRVRFRGTVVGSGAEGTTARGWQLRFERFVAAVGPVRVYADEAYARAPRPAPSLLARLSLGVAFAQHCHGCPRAPLAELGFVSGGAVDTVVDLLAPTPTDLGPANARNGLYRSVSFTFRTNLAPRADAGADPALLGGHTMVVRGTATREALTVPFEGAIDLRTQSEQTGDPNNARPYTTYGVVFDRPGGVFIEETNEVTDRVAIRVELARMFDQADFAALPEPAQPGEPRRIAEGSQVHTAWRLGVENPRTFRVGWVGAGGGGEPRP